MKVSGTNLSMVRGDTESVTVRCAEAPFQSGDTVTMTVREDVESEIALQIPVTVFDNGDAVISITHDSTKDMEFGDYVYDIQVSRADGVTVTTLVEKSKFTLREEVTY